MMWRAAIRWLICNNNDDTNNTTLCLVIWHLASPRLHRLMICTQFCIILIFKLPREHIYRELKNNTNNNKKNYKVRQCLIAATCVFWRLERLTSQRNCMREYWPELDMDWIYPWIRLDWIGL